MSDAGGHSVRLPEMTVEQAELIDAALDLALNEVDGLGGDWASDPHAVQVGNSLRLAIKEACYSSGSHAATGVDRSIIAALAECDPGRTEQWSTDEACALCGDWMSAHTNESCPWLRALDVVLNCTCDDTASPDLIGLIEAKFGPLDGGQVLVLRNVHLGSAFSDKTSGEQLLRGLVECAQARGLTGDAARYLPLVVCLDAPDASIELLNEDDMRAAGWYRSPAYPVA